MTRLAGSHSILSSNLLHSRQICHRSKDTLFKELPPKCLISHAQKNIFKLNTFLLSVCKLVLKHCIYAILQINCVLKTCGNSGPDSPQRDVINMVAIPLATKVTLPQPPVIGL